MQLTFAQFKRMKPKYKRRLILVTLIALALCIGVLFGISKGIEALRVRLNTTTLDKITAANVLDKASMNKILEVMKQDDPANVLVVDSVLTMSGEGRVTGLTMNLTNLVSQGSAEEWRLTATEKKAKLRKVKTRYENLNAQRLRLMEFKTYYPALSRAASPQLLTLLTDRAPAGANGSYTFTDHFGNNLSPEYDSFLARGLAGVWVSRIGGVSGPPQRLRARRRLGRGGRHRQEQEQEGRPAPARGPVRRPARGGPLRVGPLKSPARA